MSRKIDIDETMLNALRSDLLSVLDGQPIAKSDAELVGKLGITGVAIYVVAERFAERFDAAIDAGFPEFVRLPAQPGGAS